MTLVDENDENSPMEGVSAKRGKTISKEELIELIQKVANHDYTIGDKWYVVSQKWWTKLIEASKQGYPEDVSSINCSSISSREGAAFFLRSGLAEGVDFQLLPEVVFTRLRDAYGLEDDDRDFIERLVVKKGDTKIVEVYPRIVEVSLASDSTKNCRLHLTGTETMSELRSRVLTQLGLNDIPVDRLRFYIVNDGNNELIDPNEEKVDAYFDTAQKVLVDVETDGSWFIQTKTAPLAPSLFGPRSTAGWYVLLFRTLRMLTNWRWFLSTTVSLIFRFQFNQLSLRSYGLRERPANFIPGVCGLSNLGNTCFMASALQCLSNVPPLTEFFVSNTFLKDLNILNPLGTKGELAKAYGDLMQSMWSGEHSSVQPRKLKTVIGQFAPRFSGYAQQDSQELLAYLLDGLHEDLNRVKEKPYFEEDDNMPQLEEHVMAEKAWAAYKSRNDSIIVDRVHGQLKSTLVCPVCEKISIKFDPFCFLSVPLPPKEATSKQFVTVMYNAVPKRKWAKFAVVVSRTTTADELITIMKQKMDSKDQTIELVLFSVGDVNDDITILNLNDPVLLPDRQRDLYAAQIDHPSAQSRLIIVKNQTTTGRPLSLPMIFSIAPDDKFTTKFLQEKSIQFTKEAFQNRSTVSDSLPCGDDSMSGEEREEPYKLFVPHPTENKFEPVAQTADGILSLRDDEQISTFVFQWKEPKMFNNYKGGDLIERECTVPVKKEVHLMDCIDLFTKKEQLGEEDSWYCPRCKKHERASKRLELWNLPEVLIIHLKRFQYNRWTREKIDIPVTIPVRGFELNSKLANERHEHVKYDLIAMSHHMGGLGGGHYTGTALNKCTGKWYDFNDASTNETNTPPEPFSNRSPYMLVYRRRAAVPDGAHADSNIEMETD